VPGRDLPNAETTAEGSSRAAQVDPGAQLSALAAIGDDATVLLPDLEQHLNLARHHLHQALAHALHTLEDAERSIEEFEHRLAQHRARLRALGYPTL
jgi:hypothetical protein